MSYKGGYAGKILRINLTNKKIQQKKTPRSMVKKYIGGKGFAARILYEMERGLDPFHVENHLIIGVGPLNGTAAPCNGKFVICSKSPLTGLVGSAAAGGDFGPELKFAGYDLVDIWGKAKKPVYLTIEDNQVKLEDASHIWGKDVFETGEIISKDNNNDLAVIAIGQAGENLVRYASVIVATRMKGRAAARTGIGAVMGSKNLKAVGVMGSNDVAVANPQKFERAISKIEKIISNDPGAHEWSELGTPNLVKKINDFNGALVTRNFQSGTFENVDQISGERLKSEYAVHDHACFGCRIACGKIVAIGNGPFAGLVHKHPEFETIAMLGSNCGVGDLAVIIKAAELCDRFGLDTISTGNAIAFAIECFQRGLISAEQTGGVLLEWGDPDLILKLIHDIAFRQGLGDTLAEGVKRASEIWGEETKYYAIHVKGLELIGGDPRGQFGFALGYATCYRGGDHLGALPCFEYTNSLETAERLFGSKEAGTKLGVKGKGFLIKLREDICNITDSLVTCKMLFGTIVSEYVTNPLLEVQTWSELLSAATGISFNPKSVVKVGERISNLMRAFNVREGATREDDMLPKRILKEPLPKGGIPPIKEMLDEYYAARNWNIQTGIPTPEKLKELGLEYVIDDLHLR